MLHFVNACFFFSLSLFLSRFKRGKKRVCVTCVVVKPIKKTNFKIKQIAREKSVCREEID